MAYDSQSPRHVAAQTWWNKTLSNLHPVGLAWITVLGFIRIMTNKAVFANPLSAHAACKHARAWLAQPQVLLVHPGDRHATLCFGLLEALGTAGNLTTDAHLAALAIEHQAELQSTDADFARFPGLKWRNPLTDSR